MPFAHSIVLQLRRGGPAIGSEARALARAEDKELFHAADDVALFLKEFAAAEELLRLGTAGERGAAFRDSSYLRLAALRVGAGRWQEASGDLARTTGPGGRLARALYAGLPFVRTSPAELDEIRSGLERWSPASEPPPAGSTLEASLAGQLREWLLGLIEVKLGQDARALERAAAIERMPAAPEASAVVRSLAQTLRAGVAARQNRAAEALRLLESVRGNVPASLLRSPFYAEEPARYLRAEVLLQLGRDQEALDWLRFGFADTPAEVLYLAPAHLRQGEIYERIGAREQAAEHYERFLHLWQHCDPELEPLVSDARARLARLLEEPRSPAVRSNP